jgi:nucleoid-associated protein YgaU
MIYKKKLKCLSNFSGKMQLAFFVNFLFFFILISTLLANKNNNNTLTQKLINTKSYSNCFSYLKNRDLKNIKIHDLKFKILKIEKKPFFTEFILNISNETPFLLKPKEYSITFKALNPNKKNNKKEFDKNQLIFFPDTFIFPYRNKNIKLKIKTTQLNQKNTKHFIPSLNLYYPDSNFNIFCSIRDINKNIDVSPKNKTLSIKKNMVTRISDTKQINNFFSKLIEKNNFNKLNWIINQYKQNNLDFINKQKLTLLKLFVYTKDIHTLIKKYAPKNETEKLIDYCEQLKNYISQSNEYITPYKNEKKHSLNTSAIPPFIIVKSGDTLYNISKKFFFNGNLYKEIALINNIKPPYTIFPFQKLNLNIPYNNLSSSQKKVMQSSGKDSIIKKSPHNSNLSAKKKYNINNVKQKTSKSMQINNPKLNKKNIFLLENNNKYLVIAPGDTLYHISEKYFGGGKNFIKLAELNNILPPYIIQVGQKILISNNYNKENALALSTLKQFDIKNDDHSARKNKSVISNNLKKNNKIPIRKNSEITSVNQYNKISDIKKHNTNNVNDKEIDETLNHIILPNIDAEFEKKLGLNNNTLIEFKYNQRESVDTQINNNLISKNDLKTNSLSFKNLKTNNKMCIQKNQNFSNQDLESNNKINLNSKNFSALTTINNNNNNNNNDVLTNDSSSINSQIIFSNKKLKNHSETKNVDSLIIPDLKNSKSNEKFSYDNSQLKFYYVFFYLLITLSTLGIIIIMFLYYKINIKPSREYDLAELYYKNPLSKIS